MAFLDYMTHALILSRRRAAGYYTLDRNKKLILSILLILTTVACNLNNTGQAPASASTKSVDTLTSLPVADVPTSLPITETFTPIPTLTASAVPSETFTPIPTETQTETPYPTVDSLKAQVTAEKLSCRYGPGAEYLYLFAFNATANIKLVGRTDANNWVWVANKNESNRDNNCWVSAKFLNIQGDPQIDRKSTV